MKKPKAIVLDCDDVIVDFMGYLCWFHNNKYHTDITRNELKEYPIKDSERADIFGRLVKDQDLYKTFKEQEPFGLYRLLPAFIEARQAMEFIEDLGYSIIVMTARDSRYEIDTCASLNAQSLPWDKVILTKDKPGEINKLKEKYDVVMFVDDRLDTVVKVGKECGLEYNICMNKSWNAYGGDMSHDKPRILRVNDLMEVIKYLK